MKDIKHNIQKLLNLYKSKKLAEAESFNKKLLRDNSKVVFLYNVLGLILTDQKKIDEAINCYKEGIQIDPKYAMIYNNLGSLYKRKNDYEEAERLFKKSIKLDKNIVEPYNNLGDLFITLNDYKKSISYFKKAIEINPKFSIGQYNLAIVYKNIGKFEEAKKLLNNAILLNKNFFTAHRTLSDLIKYKKNEKHMNILKNIYDDEKIPLDEKTEIAFSLGKASDDMKKYDDAFKYFSKGNELRNKKISFSINNEKNEFNKIKDIFNRDFVKNLSSSNILESKVIFIVGMPRSGTTLVEQIVSSHPKVYGGDELYFLPSLVNTYFDDLNKIKHNNKETINKIAKEYISNVNKVSNNSKIITDKLPINFKWIGLIKLILPNSKIIHCTRSAKDTCLSIFKNYFTNPRLNFAYDLNNLLEFYNLYHSLMIHWKNTIPGFVYDVNYEKLIFNPKEEINNILQTCKLDWSDKCLEFYRNKRLIKTASDTQARKKIYKGSINSWKNYEIFMKKFFTKLPN